MRASLDIWLAVLGIGLVSVGLLLIHPALPLIFLGAAALTAAYLIE